MKYNIYWPLDTPLDFKKKLTSIARFKIGAECLPMASSLCKPTGIYYITRGVMSTTITNGAGDKDMSILFSKGDWLFSQHYLKPRPVYFSIHEIEELQFLFFSFSDIKKLFIENKDLYAFLFSISEDNNNVICQSFNNLIFEKELRLAYVLLDLQRRINNNYDFFSDDVPIFISQYQLSFLSNLSRPKLNLELKKLEKIGVVMIGRGKIIIKDVKYFEEILKKEFFSFRNPNDFLI